MELEEKKWLKKILIISGVIVLIVILAAYGDMVNFQLNSVAFKTKPCESGPVCKTCYGLTLDSICLGIEQITTKVVLPK